MIANFHPLVLKHLRKRPEKPISWHHTEASSLLNELRLEHKSQRKEREPEKRREMPFARDVFDSMREIWRKTWESTGKPDPLFLVAALTRRWGIEQLIQFVEAWKQLSKDGWLNEKAIEFAQRYHDESITKFLISEEDVALEDRALRQVPWLHQLTREVFEEERPWRNMESYLSTFEDLYKKGMFQKNITEEYVKAYVKHYRIGFEQGRNEEIDKTIAFLQKMRELDPTQAEDLDFKIWRAQESKKIGDRARSREGDPIRQVVFRLTLEALSEK